MKTKKAWKNTVKKNWKKPLIQVKKTSVLGSIPLLTVVSCSSNVDLKPNKLDDTKEKNIIDQDQIQGQEEVVNPQEEGGSGGGGSGGGGQAPANNQGSFASKANPIDELQARFNTWKKKKNSKVKRLYENHSSYGSNLITFNDQIKQEWIDSDDANPYIDNWKQLKKENLLKTNFLTSNTYNLKLQDYLNNEKNWSLEQWLASNSSTTDYQNWINNHQFDLFNIWKTTNHYVQTQGRNKQEWLSNNPEFDSKAKFLSNNASASYFEKWIEKNQEQLIKTNWDNSDNYRNFYNSTKAALLVDPRLSTKEKFADTDEATPGYQKWVSQNLQTFKNLWKQSDDYAQYIEMYKYYWQTQNPSLDTIEKYVQRFKGSIDIDAWKLANESKVKSYWKTTNAFENEFNTYKSGWKIRNSSLDTKEKFANSNESNSAFNTWKTTKPKELVDVFKNNAVYTTNLSGFTRSYKLDKNNLNTKAKFLADDASTTYYDKWRLLKPIALQNLWKSTSNYNDYLATYKESWKSNNINHNTKEKYANSLESDSDYNNWITTRPNALREKWLTSSDFTSSLNSFKNSWKQSNPSLDTKEKFAANSLSDQSYSQWAAQNHKILTSDWLKSDTESNLIAAYKTKFDEQNPTKSTVAKWVENNYHNQVKFLSWKKSKIADIVSVWKQDGDKYANSLTSFVNKWKLNNPQLNTKEKFINNSSYGVSAYNKWLKTSRFYSLDFWKGTKDYKKSLERYTTNKIDSESDNILETLTTNEQYNEWVQSNPTDQLDNWVEFTTTHNPRFKRFKEVYLANNNQETYMGNNFPQSRYEEWKKTDFNFFEEWKKHTNKDLIFQNWMNSLPSDDKDIAKSKFLGKNDDKETYYLNYISNRMKYVKGYPKAFKQKFKTWIENSPNSYMWDFQKTLPLDEQSHTEYFKSHKTHHIWKEWFRGKLSADSSLEENFITKWKKSELKGVHSYSDAYNDFITNTYTIQDFIKLAKADSTLENNLYNKYKQDKINKLKTNPSFTSKSSWLANISPEVKSQLHVEWIKTEPQVLFDKYYESDSYNKDLKEWDDNLDTNYNKIEKWAQNYADQTEYSHPNPNLIIGKDFAQNDIEKYWDSLVSGTLDKESDFWNIETYVKDNPRDFLYFLFSTMKGKIIYPKTNKIELRTPTYRDVNLALDKGQKMPALYILEKWVNTRMPEMRKKINAANRAAGKPEIGSLLPLVNNDGFMRVAAAQNRTNGLNVSNLPTILTYLADHTKPEFVLFIEFMKLIRYLVPDLETLKPEGYTEIIYILDGAKICRSTTSGPFPSALGGYNCEGEAGIPKASYQEWLEKVKEQPKYNFDDSTKAELKKTLLPYNMTLRKLRNPDNSNGQKNYASFKKKKFDDVIKKDNFHSGKYIPKYLKENPLLVAQEFAKSDLAQTEYKKAFTNKLLTSTFGSIEPQHNDIWRDEDLAAAFKKYYIESPSIFNNDYLSAIDKRIEEDGILDRYFSNYIDDFSNRVAIDKLYSIRLNAPDLVWNTYKSFLIDKYYRNINFQETFNHWKTNQYIWSHEFNNEYNQSLEGQLKFMSNAQKEFMQSDAIQKSFQEWKKSELNIINAYKKSEDAKKYYLDSIETAYYQQYDKTQDFLTQIQTRSVGQRFYELSGQAKKDLTTNLKSSYDGSREQYADFLVYLDGQKDAIKIYKNSDYSTTHYNEFLEKEYQKSQEFKTDMDQWMSTGTNGIDVYKTSQLASTHYDEFINDNFHKQNAIVQKLVEDWGVTKANGLNSYQKATKLEEDYDAHLLSEFKKDATFDSEFDKWAANKGNGLAKYKESQTLQNNYDNFLLGKFISDKDGFTAGLNAWSETKANGIDTYKADSVSNSDYDSFITSEFQKSTTFNVEFDNWATKANGLNIYLNNEQLEKDYEQHLLKEYTDNNLDFNYVTWSSNQDNVWESFTNGVDSQVEYNNYIKTQFENDTQNQNKYLYMWANKKENLLANYKTSAQLETDYSNYLDAQIAKNSGRTNRFMLWAKNTQSIIDQYAQNPDAITDYQKFIDQRYKLSNQQEAIDFNSWVNTLLSDKSLGIDYYKNAVTSNQDYNLWINEQKRSEAKYKLNHFGQFSIDFEGWLSSKDNIVDFYKADSMSSMDYQTWTQLDPANVSNYVTSSLYNNHLDQFVENVLTWDKYGTQFISEDWE